ncbi:MAG: hypothetical protein AAFV29_18615, partial [Myxococcota bacterium]
MTWSLSAHRSFIFHKGKRSERSAHLRVEYAGRTELVWHRWPAPQEVLTHVCADAGSCARKGR